LNWREGYPQDVTRQRRKTWKTTKSPRMPHFGDDALGLIILIPDEDDPEKHNASSAQSLN
jgi:hypothetical protein